MKIAELFISIQGESSYAGKPCFFIRLAGCNLNCSYCDTEFAKSAGNGSEYSVDNLVAVADKSGVRLVEITGGEPLLQEDVPELCGRLKDAGFTVLVETNGSLRISQLPPEVIRIIDCKCPSSGESESMCLANFAYITPADEIKFVICDRADFDYACKIVSEYDLESRVENILFSPVVSDSLSPALLAEWILEIRFPVRLQLQLHKIIWNPGEQGR